MSEDIFQQFWNNLEKINKNITEFFMNLIQPKEPVYQPVLPQY